MSQRSIISASIQANFPDNTSEFITPTRLRDEQNTFLNDTVLNEQTASIIAEAVASASLGTGLVTTASFNAYTASTNTFTQSIQTQVNTLQAATGSYITSAQTGSMSVLSASYASSSTSASYASSSTSASYASTATSASYALTASYAQNAAAFPYTGSAQITGSLGITGSIEATNQNGLVINWGASNTIPNAGAVTNKLAFGNSITNNSSNNGFAFGDNHTIAAPGYNNFIAGGNGNTLNNNRGFAGGGISNVINAIDGATIGGNSNTVAAGHDGSIILGGSGIITTDSNGVFLTKLFMMDPNTPTAPGITFGESGSNQLSSYGAGVVMNGGTFDMTASIGSPGGANLRIFNGSVVTLFPGAAIYAPSGSTVSTGSANQVLTRSGSTVTWANQSATIDTGSFATTGSNQFNGNQSISGSLHQSGTFYPDQIDWISSSIQQGTGSYILTTDSNGVTQYDNFQNIASALQPYIQTGSVINTGSFATTGSNTFNGTNTFTGSVNIQSASITFLTVDTIVSSSTINNTGSNQLGDNANDTQTLWGTVNLKDSNLYLSSGSLGFAFTASTATQYPNIIFPRVNAASQSGSAQFAGKNNIIMNAGFNSGSAFSSSFNGNSNIIVGNVNWSASAAQPNLSNNYFAGNIVVTGSNSSVSNQVTFTTNQINGTVTVDLSKATGSNAATVSSVNNIINGTLTISSSISGSTTFNTLNVTSNNFAGTGQVIKASGAGRTANTTIGNNIIGGTINTVSIEGTGAGTGFSNALIFGSNLVYSGSSSGNNQSSSVILGQFNETGSLALDSQIRFAIGAGASTGSRLTPIYVSASGETVIKPNTTGNGRSIFGNNFTAIADGAVNGTYTTVGSSNGSFVTNAGSITGGGNNVINAIIAAESATITNGRQSVIIAGETNTINVTVPANSQRPNIIAAAKNSTIAGATSGSYNAIIGASGSIISQSNASVILANPTVGTTIINASGSVALGRDTAYTVSGSYTLYTQNIEASGSATITDVLVLPLQNPLPSGKPTGSIALSGSAGVIVGMYAYNGTTWQLI